MTAEPGWVCSVCGQTRASWEVEPQAITQKPIYGRAECRKCRKRTTFVRSVPGLVNMPKEGTR